MKDTKYDFIDSVMKTIQEQRKRNDMDGLLKSGELCLEIAYKLVHLSVENESAYRKFEANLADKTEDGKRLSSAYCETKAKATDEYAEWQRARQVINVLLELATMSKKLAGNVDSSLKAS